MSSESRDGKSWRPRGFGAIAAGMAALAVAMPTAASAKAEKGPTEIVVTNYPAAARESYKAFAAKCARCHTITRAIVADHVLPSQWETAVERMMKKWFSGINKAMAKQIMDFLIYDSSIRKKPLLEAALAKLSPEARKAAEDRIAEIRLRYEQAPPAP